MPARTLRTRSVAQCTPSRQFAHGMLRDWFPRLCRSAKPRRIATLADSGDKRRKWPGTSEWRHGKGVPAPDEDYRDSALDDPLDEPFDASFDADDGFDDALVTEKFQVVPGVYNQPMSAQQLADLDRELTSVDPPIQRSYRQVAHDDTERSPETHVSVSRYNPPRPPTHSQPRVSPPSGYDGHGYSSRSVDPRVKPEPRARPRGKPKTALPLPAPPSHTGNFRIPTDRSSEEAVPERMTLAGTTRTPAPNFQSFVHQRPPTPAKSIPVPIPAPMPQPKKPDYSSNATAVSRSPQAPLKQPLVGGKYHLVERIGAGGMGKVFKVAHSQLGKTFALKIISDNLARDSKVRELFYREARMASSLSHPNIASVVDFGEDENLGAFMVMELLTGKPLHKILHKEKRLSIRRSSDIIRQLAEALGYIHSKGIVHCDIKTENILLCELPGAGPRKQEQVKLLDFGLAKNITGGRNTTSLSGTPHYVAPERIRGAQPSPSNDIYGVGILYYELLTGRVPWDGNVDHILNGHLNMAPVPPSRLIEGGLDPAVEKLVLRALAKTPEERHKNMAAFLYELKTVMDMLGYGRRKRGAAKKISRANQRDEMARSLFDASRVPMALIQRGGNIVIANKAFAQFIMGVSVDVEGMNVTNTPLITAWTTFDADFTRAAAGTSMRRVIELEIEPGRMRRLLMWLDPGLNDEQAIFGVHPLDH